MPSPSTPENSEFRQAASQRLPATPDFPLPENELDRLTALLEYDVLDSMPEQCYDDLTAIAAHICGTPIALISLLDGDRQWFKSRYGIDTTETPRDYAFCAHAILTPDQALVVPDALEDERFRENPLVTGDPHIRFYAGTPLVNAEGMALGTLCAIDSQPRQLSKTQIASLQALGRQAIAQLELRRQTAQLKREKQALQTTLQTLQSTQADFESEKMQAISQLVVDIVQKLSNPLTFIQGNLAHGKDYTLQLIHLIKLYRDQTTPPEAIAEFAAQIDLDYIITDLPRLFFSMEYGMAKVSHIAETLQTFTRPREVGLKQVDLHDSLDAICDLLSHHGQVTGAQADVTIERRYDDVPKVLCYPSQLNQALMYLVKQAIRAVEQGVGKHHGPHATPHVTIATSQTAQGDALIVISDNSAGLTAEQRSHLFDGTDTAQADRSALAMSHQTIEQVHHGSLQCHSEPGRGTDMIVTLPLQPTTGT